ncbi:MAG: RdgB/HAM1 family non-canonical purine NTP pyrophosphatase [Brevinematia bacterium]
MRLKFGKILIATTNKHKFEEIRSILSGFLKGVSFLSLSNLKKVKEPEENGRTFFENALIKAKYYYSLFKIPVIAEDSGLEVEALNGEPGVLSARYAGPNSTQESLIRKLLKNMEGKVNRNASFVCCVVFMYDKDRYIFSEGVVRGSISYSPKGNYGFGYDPVFIPQGYDKTFAELGPKLKNQISHRRKALLELVVKLSETNLG